MRKNITLFFLVVLTAILLLPAVYFSCHQDLTVGLFKSTRLYCPVSEIGKGPAGYLVFVDNISQVKVDSSIFLLLVLNFYLSLPLLARYKFLPINLDLSLLSIRDKIRLALSKGLIRRIVFE